MLVAHVEDLFPGSSHVRSHDMGSASDIEVWDFAAASGFTIVSKDSDFHQRSFLLGHPPKVVWLRLGNCTTSDVLQLIRDQAVEIKSFGEDVESSFLALS